LRKKTINSSNSLIEESSCQTSVNQQQQINDTESLLQDQIDLEISDNTLVILN
ncbi:8429_t:CDS:1, partial [Dentiscutata erythropus]